MKLNAYRLIENDIESMKALSRQAIGDVSPYIAEIVQYSLQFSGKCLRPALLFLVGKMFGELNVKHLYSAAAVEFVHTATLIHDDIIDGAALRRHLIPVSVRWNAQVAVLAGDLLLSKSLELMTDGGDSFGMKRLTTACKLVCEGELRQITSAGRFDMSMDDYLQIIDGKTASLLACSAELGAYFSGADTDTVEKCRQFGQKIGIAFQMVDDILDIVGETDNVGKTLQTDLVNCKLTLPVLVYLQSATEEEKQTMLKQLRCGHTETHNTVQMLIQSGAVQAAKQRVHQEINEALKILSGIDGQQEVKSAIEEVTLFVAQRNM